MIKKYFDGLMVAIVASCIVLYDVVIDLMLDTLHMIFELIHLLYEWFELGIEHGVQHLFHLSRHASQIVTFYILLTIAIALACWLWRVIPRLYKRYLTLCLLAVENAKVQLHAYWLSLTLGNKLGLISTALGVVCLTSFFAM